MIFLELFMLFWCRSGKEAMVKAKNVTLHYKVIRNSFLFTPQLCFLLKSCVWEGAGGRNKRSLRTQTGKPEAFKSWKRNDKNQTTTPAGKTDHNIQSRIFRQWGLTIWLSFSCPYCAHAYPLSAAVSRIKSPRLW